jgi:hypothetical protein
MDNEKYIEEIKQANIDTAVRLREAMIFNINKIPIENHKYIEGLSTLLNSIIYNGKTSPIDKSSRALGYVQGMLLIQDVEEINKELESTFDIFEKIESKYRKSPLSAFCNIKK